MVEPLNLERVNGNFDYAAAVRQGAYDAVMEYLQAHGLPQPHEPQPLPQPAEDIAEVRGEPVYLRGPHPILFSRWRQSCPSCSGLIQVDDRIIGFARVDNPSQCIWVCRYCAPVEAG